MASFREHIAFSSALGVGYAFGAAALLEFTPEQALLGGFLAGIGGMLPDLDSPTGKPGKEIFALTAAAVPLVLIGHVLAWTGLPPETETVMLLLLSMYFTIRYGLAWVVDKLSVHRGMFHSLPAMAIAAEVTYLAYPSELTTVKLLMGTGIAIGFFSHLLLDEIYSFKWSGPLPGVKKSFGTAIKFTGQSFGATAFTYAILATLSFLTMENAGLVGPPEEQSAIPMAEQTDTADIEPVLRHAEFPEPSFQRAELPTPRYQEAVRPEDDLQDAPLFR